jgi:hypothetical protein
LIAAVTSWLRAGITISKQNANMANGDSRRTLRIDENILKFLMRLRLPFASTGGTA